MSKRTITVIHPACVAVVLATLSFGARAVDGVVLIDQNKALAGNVTPGDSPGFPVTITQPGSYRLAGNLTVPDANTSAIVIAPGVAGVSLDLNGFTIAGPTVCQGYPLACSPTGNGAGVTVGSTSAPSKAVTVRNGFITGMGGTGVLLFGSGSTATDLSVWNNGVYGIYVQLGQITGNRIFSNRFAGISGGNAVIMHNFVSSNGASGIDVNDSLVVNNTIVTNGGLGLNASNTAFSGNQFSSNNGSYANPQFAGRVAIGPNGCDGSVCP